jgi:fumarate hydratase class I
LAKKRVAPICQDTGTPVAWVSYPQGASTRLLQAALEEAVRKATELNYLRPNAVDSVTGKNTGDGSGRGIPHVHFSEWDDPAVEVRLILKGGGCENVGIQYKLPDTRLGAGRDLEGVRRVVLDSVVQAQGKGCAPGVLGVAVGGDRVSGFEESKCQLLRPLADPNTDAELAGLEERLLREGNELGIGPMGFGGETTLLGVKIGVLDRLPASYFVTVSYMCWADRRAGVRIENGGEPKWLS